VSILSALALAATGCGGDEPDPDQVLDRALTRANLAGFVSAPGGGTVAVQALGYEDRILESKEVRAEPKVMAEIGDALGSSGGGLRGLVEGLELEGSDEIGGAKVDHVSGEIDEAGLAEALRGARRDAWALTGAGAPADLEESLAGAEFDAYVGADDGVIRRLDLTLSVDDPGNALPPARIRFSLTPGRKNPDTE